MTGLQEQWTRYERWNSAIAEVVYSPANAGQPVYLDLEDDIIQAIRDLAEPETASPAEALVEAAKGTLLLSDRPSRVLSGHLSRLDRWYEGSMFSPPPTLGLLAMLSLVAENMRHSDDMKAHNFYGRLAELAKLGSDEVKRFEIAYRHKRHKQGASAELWDSLNDWLEIMEGQRGLPTAFPVGHDHIGLPLSQALVRQADRDKFTDLFASQGLAAGSSLPTSEMSAQIDEWMSRIPCPASNTLEHLWKDRPPARQPISEVAVRTLEAWNGAVSEGFLRQSIHREIDAVRLRAVLRTFGSKRIELTMIVPGRTTSDVEKVAVLDNEGESIAIVDMVPCASGWLGVCDDAAIEAGSFLAGHVRLQREDQDMPLRRRPRRLVPLRWDDLLQAYVECERVQLGVDTLIIARSEIAPAVATFLAKAARPGFRQVAELQGMPVGWNLFEGVQILCVLPKDPWRLLDLSVLEPLARSQIVLQGGLKLPGHQRKWLSARPPELRVSSDAGTELIASLTCTRPLANPTPPDLTQGGSGSILIWDLATADLPDGDYQISVDADGELAGSERLRLRSADNPALPVDPDSDPIVNDPLRSNFGLFAVRSSSPSGFAGLPTHFGALTAGEPPAVPGWWKARSTLARSSSGVQVIRFPLDGPSCIETGGHIMALPMGLEGQSSIEGVCRNCGLVKRYPTKYRPGRKSITKQGAAIPTVRVGDLPPVRPEGGIDWAVAFDAVCHVGSGPMASLDRITAQMEATDLFGDAFARKMDVLGHIEIERHSHTLTGMSWQLNNPIVVGLTTGDLTVIGFRSEKVMVAIEDEVWRAGGEFEAQANVSAPPVLRIAGLDAEGAEKLAAAIAVAAMRPASYVPNAAMRLAAALPPLSRARSGLPTTLTPSARSVEAWNPVTARFEPATDAAGQGAFRLNSHTRAYVYRRAEDLGAMRALLGDARIVKYLAAADRRSSLVGYDSAAEILYVPLGADLPGLYGRAAALASGNPPLENLEEKILEYRKVPPSLAAHLADLLMT